MKNTKSFNISRQFRNSPKKKWPRNLISIVIFLVAYIFSLPSFAGSLSVDGYSLVSMKRVSRVVFQYTYKLQLTNSSQMPLTNVEADVTSSCPATSIIDNQVDASSILPGDFTPEDTFTISQDRTVPLQPSCLSWSLKYSFSKNVTSSGGTLEVTDQTDDLFGTKLIVPDGAVSQDTNFTLTKGPEGKIHDIVGKSVDFGPDGTFNSPVQISIPLVQPLSQKSVLMLMKYNASESRFEYEGRAEIGFPGDTVENFITNHFTTYNEIGLPECDKDLSGNYVFGIKSCAVIGDLNQGGIKASVKSFSLVQIALTKDENPSRLYVHGSYDFVCGDNSRNFPITLNDTFVSAWEDYWATDIANTFLDGIFNLPAGTTYSDSLRKDIENAIDIPSVSKSQPTEEMYVEPSKCQFSMSPDDTSDKASYVGAVMLSLVDTDRDIVPSLSSDNMSANLGTIRSTPVSIEGSLSKGFINPDGEDSFSFTAGTSGTLNFKIKTSNSVMVDGLDSNDFTVDGATTDIGGQGIYGNEITYSEQVDKGQRYSFSLQVPDARLQQQRYYDFSLSIRGSVGNKVGIIVNDSQNPDVVSNEFVKMMRLGGPVDVIGADQISQGSVDLSQYGTLTCFISGDSGAVSNFSSSVLDKIVNAIENGATMLTDQQDCGAIIAQHAQLADVSSGNYWGPALNDSTSFTSTDATDPIFNNVASFNGDIYSRSISQWDSGDPDYLLFRVQSGRGYGPLTEILWSSFTRQPDKFLASQFGTGFNIYPINPSWPEWKLGKGRLVVGNGLHWTYDEATHSGGYIGVAGQQILKNIGSGVNYLY